MTKTNKDRKTISAEEALFTVEATQARVVSVADDLAQLAVNLRELLPAGPGADVTRPIDELAQRLRAVAINDLVESVRSQIMEHGLPIDEVCCTRCESADFSNQDCEACCAVRSDGRALARRLEGWIV